MDDIAWAGAATIDEFFAYQSGGDPAAAVTSARILWDEDYLYVGFDISDVDIRSSCGIEGECGRDSKLFRGDVIELFVREDTDLPRYHEFEWSPVGDEFDARYDEVRFGSPGTDWDSSGMVSAAQVNGTVDQPGDTDHSWTVEVAIPLSDFELKAVTVGTEWTFTVARYDYYNQPPTKSPALMMSTPGDPDAPLGGVTAGFHTYEIYDILAFVQNVPGDANGDGWVDGLDYLLWAEHYGESPSQPSGASGGDFNGDQLTDGLDYLLWASQYGAHVGGATVPEQSSLLMLLSGCLALVRRRR
ncbi:MAG: sugar-binding protein [Pirellulales bacterium]